MRIGFDTRYITPNRTGLGNYSASLLGELIRQCDSCEFVLFGSRPDALTEFMEHDNVTVRKVPALELPLGGRISSVAHDQIWLAKAISRERLDLVHYPYYLEPLLSPEPFILTVHDMDTFSGRGRHSIWTRAYHNSLIRLLSKRCRVVVTDSEFSRAEIIGHLGLPPEKVRVVSPGLPAWASRLGERQPGPPGAASGAGSIAAAGGYFLYTGGLGMRKNLVRLVDAFSQAREATGSQAKLVITGEIAEVGRALQRHVERRGLADQVEFTGYVGDEAMTSLYAGARACVYPSLYEGFGLPVLEAMAAGVPVVTSGGSSMEEIAGGRALLADPTDTGSLAAAMGALMADRGLARRLGRLGPAQAAAFTWEKAALDFADIYSEVAA